mmetsp:Transcript_3904/g.9377  ORF Transcript_3904/g.9377 Transcript_3904/m.9377 type:complete len:440 (-) Transcript_3904:98-1417(-)|eukprot:CAMPEP_0197576096 /NCGR_PEP_ID=MMETSP1326-20131121/1246_1 /TAXON_ID=1155430 /ORGANISM="Genus nov. species nov., Strain RCC2288" /LENGTH=439 /DNA_ID=CAMNT_0043138953 /DNA_START=94 /DNA_END=1413 /DNA_ORIENTATION=+
MRLKVSLVPGDEASIEVANVNIECGTGEQILRWLAFTACSRLSYIRGEVPGAYVPQAVLNQEGLIRDVDTVINELHGDGDTVVVQFTTGPEAFKSRWDGRPKTPPFRWGADGLIGATDEDWLQDGLDLHAFAVDDMVSEDLARVSPDAKDQDIKATHALLVKHGGALQAMFKFYESFGDVDMRDVDKMNLEQFRQCMRDAKVTNDHFKPSNVDECFSEVQVQNRKGGAKKTSNESSIHIEAFFVAVLRVAARKYAMGREGGFAELNMRLSHFITTHVYEHIGPIFQKDYDSLKGCLTSETELLLRKGRRLTQQTLDSCQLRRVAAAERRLDVRYLGVHLSKWGLLGKPKGAGYLELAKFVVFAKQRTNDLTQFVVHQSPYELNYDEFERMLAALAFHMYGKVGEGGAEREEPFVEFLGEFLDDIFRKAGVLLEVSKDDE